MFTLQSILVSDKSEKRKKFHKTSQPDNSQNTITLECHTLKKAVQDFCCWFNLL